eukprot:12528-Heterococcus_DN1.PRE.3
MSASYLVGSVVRGFLCDSTSNSVTPKDLPAPYSPSPEMHSSNSNSSSSSSSKCNGILIVSAYAVSAGQDCTYYYNTVRRAANIVLKNVCTATQLVANCIDKHSDCHN